jgi:hypothetical protein
LRPHWLPAWRRWALDVAARRATVAVQRVQFGLNAGAASGQSAFSTNPNCPPAIVDATFCNASPVPTTVNGAAVAESGKGKLSPSGFTGGAQAGYNWQRGHIVYGGEVDFGILDVGKRATQSGMFPVAFLGTQYTLTQKVNADWLATLRTPGLHDDAAHPAIRDGRPGLLGRHVFQRLQ